MKTTGSSRRAFLKQSFTLAAAPMLNRGRYRLFERAEREYSAKAVELVGRSLVIDMLSPLTLDFDKSARWLSEAKAFTSADWEVFRSSGIRAFHIAVGIGGRDAYEAVLEFVGAWNGFVAQHPDWFRRVTSVDDLKALRTNAHIGILIGVQDSDHFREVDDVARFHGLGQRVSQLTYNSRNLIGNGSTERTDGGLSDFGVEVVARMNEVGMAVDVSHSGDRTTLDACEVSKRPVLFTHANCRAIASHPRCKTDEAIRKMAATGGVMGVTGVRMFVRTEEPTTIEHVLDHFDHVRDLVGIEHLGLGSDMDLYGYDALPKKANDALRAGYKGSYAFRNRIDIEGLDHPKRVFDLTEGLLRRGYGDRDVELVLGGNFERVLGQIWGSN
jgi:membrane dipeptidase